MNSTSEKTGFTTVQPLTSGSLVLGQPLEGEEGGDGLVHQFPQHRLVQARLPSNTASSPGFLH
jgi:hypothetical protein